jgi:hypothetical protein
MLVRVIDLLLGLDLDVYTIIRIMKYAGEDVKKLSVVREVGEIVLRNR